MLVIDAIRLETGCASKQDNGHGTENDNTHGFGTGLRQLGEAVDVLNGDSLHGSLAVRAIDLVGQAWLCLAGYGDLTCVGDG